MRTDFDCSGKRAFLPDNVSPKWGDALPEYKDMVRREIASASSDLSKEDQAILLAIAEHESGLNPSAKNPASTAHGVFQVIDRTWSGLGFGRDKRGDLFSQIKAGIKLYKENLGVLKRRGLASLHGAARLIEMYTLHHDGPSGKDFGGRTIAQNHVTRRVRWNSFGGER